MATTKQMQALAKARKAKPKQTKAKSTKSFLTDAFVRGSARLEALMLEEYIKHPESIVHYYTIPEERIRDEKASPLRTPTKITEGVLLKTGTGVPLHCSQNVLAKLRENPELKYELGIIKYENPKDATHVHYEGHVVIKHPDGKLEDVTGSLDNETYINFIPLNVEDKE